jgi:hypothetical protein
MSEKNGSPPRLTASTEAEENERPLRRRSRARQPSKAEPTPMQVKKPPQDMEPESPLPSDLHLHDVPRGMLDRSLQAQLGRQLRAIFSDVAEEPVPDRFIKLLEELETKEKGQ